MNNLKNKPQIKKKSSKAKLISIEYAIIEKDGTVKATDKPEEALKEAKNGKTIFLLKTYQITTTTKEKLKFKED